MIEIKIGMIGGADHGKSSLIGVLATGQLDDGRGLARQKIMRFKHELISGRTSSITENYMKMDEKTEEKTECDISKKYYTFVDTAGQEKYLKTTMYGLSGYHIDYAIILIGANMGVSVVTKEHLMLAIILKIPFMFVITKIDMTPANILQETIANIHKLLATFHIPQSRPLEITNAEDYVKINMTTDVPIFKVSNKDGYGIELLRNYLFFLEPRFDWISARKQDITRFVISHRYNVRGIGTIFSGKVMSGTITRGDKMLLGPFNGKWINVVAKSMHNNFKTAIEELKAGESGCIAIKTKTGEFNNKGKLRKGLVMINKYQDAVRAFDAEISISTRHSTTIRRGYSPIVNCNSIVQIAKVTEIYDREKDFLRCGDRAKVQFAFCFRPEFIHEGERIIFRDGKTKGYGRITKIYY